MEIFFGIVALALAFISIWFARKEWEDKGYSKVRGNVALALGFLSSGFVLPLVGFIVAKLAPRKEDKPNSTAGQTPIIWISSILFALYLLAFVINKYGVVWIIVVGIIFLLIVGDGAKRKCDNCKKWNAMKKIGTKCVDEKPTTVVEKREHKNRNGHVISSWEVDVPATIYYYQTYRKCNHCGYGDYLESSKTEKN